MDLEFNYRIMVKNIMENLRMIKEMVMEQAFGQMELNIMANLKMT